MSASRSRRTKLLLLVAVMLVSVGWLHGCHLFSWSCFRRDARVRLLLGRADRDLARTYFRPTWEPDGEALLFLATPVGSLDFAAGGALWRYSYSTGDVEELLLGPFGAFDVSQDGRTVVLSRGNGREGGGLLIYDTKTHDLRELGAGNLDVIDLAFSRMSPEKLYYSSLERGAFSITLDGVDETLVDSSVRTYFCLTRSDSVLVLPGSPKPRVDGEGRRVMRTYEYWESKSGDIAVVGVNGGDTTWFPARPYEYAQVYYANWSPDERRVTYTAHEIASGSPTAEPFGLPGELWEFNFDAE